MAKSLAKIASEAFSDTFSEFQALQTLASRLDPDIKLVNTALKAAGSLCQVSAEPLQNLSTGTPSLRLRVEVGPGCYIVQNFIPENGHLSLSRQDFSESSCKQVGNQTGFILARNADSILAQMINILMPELSGPEAAKFVKSLAPPPITDAVPSWKPPTPTQQVRF